MKIAKRALATIDTSIGDLLLVVDTSFLYALFSSSDMFHKRARQAAKQPTVLVVPSEIFAETVMLIHYRVGFEAARAAGEWIRSQGNLRLRPATATIVDRAWAAFLKARGRISYADSVVLAWCRELRAKPLAFDRGILRRWREGAA